ncbi:hypothetical protein ACH4LN_29020 [Streptomyces albus]|uniref:Uncharacterized protein n=1 Tax=Streptomyces albus TaxID=1888 RepID=A0A6C1C320_9ACTN|nr:MULTISPECIES: hypothetical protein [Streptomyces]KPC91416.1 hypothetical protein ADL27_30050 [Streptomyces sp. NRRL F-6602]EPD95355.1 hypothetical protein HMPREF1486_02142 [Streptomyces sp. HPH0547]MDI6408133.1 hypothetical protein [Streptomyces albus]QID36387.1 hypothetical protein G3260_002545 [Streptomyces albus]TGG83467.1 hypothetical protein D8771_15760 [Streptomyces albus]
MTATVADRLVFADPGEAAGLAAFLERLLRWEKNAAVRIRAGGGVAGVFAKPARFEVLAVRTGRLLEPVELDVTVAAGELLERVEEERESVGVPSAVTGPSWAGVLPPRGGWQEFARVPVDAVGSVAAAAVGEFRQRAEKLPPERRGRQTLDALAEEIWSRPLGRTGLPLRAAHAAHALGFLRGSEPVVLLEAGAWLRLRTVYGSVAVRRRAAPGTGPGGGLSVTPV